MDDFWEIVAELGIEPHPDRIAAIADRIGSLKSLMDYDLVKSSFGSNVDHSSIEKLRHVLKETTDISPAEFAAALRGASAASALVGRRGSVELVWTGPSTEMVPVRHTEQVLCEVIESARRRLFLVSFVAYKVDSIVSALRGAVARQVSIEVMLEPSTEHGGKVSVDSVKTMKDSLPSANVYVWNAEAMKKECGKHERALHAKCAVADSEMAFITSANLSTAAMERNMELGVLIRGGHLPKELANHLHGLIATGVVERA